MMACMMFLTSCISVNNEFEGIPPGKWRAYFKIYDNELENANLAKADMKYKELPFNFEVKQDTEGNPFIELMNGDERIVLKDLSIGIDRSTAKDTITIDFPVYQSYIKAIYEDGIMEGNWYVKYKEGYSIPFVAKHGDTNRFKQSHQAPATDLTGKWKTTFDFDKEEPYMAVAELVQNGSKLTGTFLTETGDYRFLEGIVQGKKMYLSVFDGAHAFLFEALIEDDNSLVGVFKSGKHYTCLLYTSPSPRDQRGSRMPSSA